MYVLRRTPLASAGSVSLRQLAGSVVEEIGLFTAGIAEPHGSIAQRTARRAPGARWLIHSLAVSVMTARPDPGLGVNLREVMLP